MQRYAFFPNCNKNMQNINHFLIFSNTYNPKHPPPPTKKKESPPNKIPSKKIRVLRAAPSAPKIPHHKIPSKKIRVLRVLRAAPSAPKIPHQKNPPPQKRQKKIATRQAGSNHHIKQLLSLNQKI